MKRITFLILLASLLMSNCKSQKTGNSGEHKYTNKLIGESSPYLLQHAHNPVNWYPWGKEALEKAKAEDKLLLISIGYAACHWCHVMEHESFEDSTVAKVMNDNFVCIKVDREERPDVDDVYMTACHLSSQGNCGWPLNSIALPDSRPIWAGTYFPKDQWIKVLDHFRKAKENEYSKLVQYADRLEEGIKSSGQIAFNEGEKEFTKEALEGWMRSFAAGADMEKGGIRARPPKFPMPAAWELALKWNHYNPDAEVMQATTVMLDAMANGGIFDQLGGGFARYSTDADWHVPHFEKMLYDNGQLVSLYSHAYQVTKNPRYKQVVEETLEFIKREMTDPAGGFYSSLDADSDGAEGKYYVWTKDEIDMALNDEAASEYFNAFFDVSGRGNWEHGNNVLRRRKTTAELAKKFKISEEALLQSIAQSKKILLPIREKRVHPPLDDKVLTAWNGLMLKGYCDAYRALGNEEYRKTAIKTGEFILKYMLQPDGRLNRNYKDGKSVINAFLDDYAATANAFVALYEITFDEKWLNKATQMLRYATEHFKDDKTGMYFYTSDLDASLITRKMEFEDNVIPGSNSMMARALNKIGTYTDNNEWKENAAQMLHNMQARLNRGGEASFYANWLQLWLDEVRPRYEVAIVGNEADRLRKEVSSHFIPNAFLMGGKKEGSLELLKDKLVAGSTMIYVCQNKVCKFPVDNAEKALELF